MSLQPSKKREEEEKPTFRQLLRLARQKKPRLTRATSDPNTSEFNMGNRRPLWDFSSDKTGVKKPRGITSENIVKARQQNMRDKKKGRSLRKAKSDAEDVFTPEDLDAAPLDWDDLRTQSRHQKMWMTSKKMRGRNVKEFGLEHFPEEVSFRKGKIGGKRRRTRRRRRRRRRRKTKKRRKKSRKRR